MNKYTFELNPKYKLKEFRHPTNNNLLCKAIWKGHIEIYDKKSRQTIYTWPSRKSNDEWVKWVEFQSLSRDLRCPTCGRLLCRWLGYNMFVEVKCTHCKEVHGFSMKKLYDFSYKTIPLIAQKNILQKIKSLTF